MSVEGIKCGKCGSIKTKVIDSRKQGNSVARVRRCRDCDHSTFTYEVADHRTRTLTVREASEITHARDFLNKILERQEL